MLQHIILCWTCILSLLLASAFSRRIEIPLENISTKTSILPVSSIRDIQRSSLYMCIRECRSRPHCHAVSFFMKTLMCRLAGSQNYKKFDDEVYTLNVREGITSEDFDGPCANTTCPSQHQCIVASNNQPLCPMRECPTLVETPIDGFSVSNEINRPEKTALGTVSTALNKSCPSGGYPGPNIRVQVLCKTGGWAQIGDINCYACDAAVYIGYALRACYKQMTVNQTYSAAMNQCYQNGSLATINGPTFLTEFVSITNECTWIDAKYDVGQEKWLKEFGENFVFIIRVSSYRSTASYTSSMRQVLCPDGVFKFRDGYLTAGTICDIK